MNILRILKLINKYNAISIIVLNFYLFEIIIRKLWLTLLQVSTKTHGINFNKINLNYLILKMKV